MMHEPAVFIDLSVEDQAEELKVYFNRLGAKLPTDSGPTQIEEQLKMIISVCDMCFQNERESEIESVLNAIVSMLVLLPIERAESLILSFSIKLSQAQDPRLASIAIRVLWVLFQSLDKRYTTRFNVYYHVVQIAKNDVDQIKAVFKGVDYLKQQFSECHITTEQMQKLLRSLHEILLQSHDSEQAAKVMMELLGTYTKDNASHAREDAERCIISSIADPDTFLLDPLLSLKPVSCLKGDKIYELLTIFVSEKLSNYLDFYKKHKEYVDGLGLVHEKNIKKMRLLTFMQIAEGTTEISFDTIMSELQIQENEVEDFIIEVLKTRLVRARMDQSASKVHIVSTMHRTFGRPQWQQVEEKLNQWKTNLQIIDCGMKDIVQAQMEANGDDLG